MADDDRIVFDCLGRIRPVRLCTFFPLIHTSKAPPAAASLSRVTTRIQAPREIVAAVPEIPPDPPNLIWLFWTNISSHGPSGFSGDHCWNVTFWLWNCQPGGR